MGPSTDLFVVLTYGKGRLTTGCSQTPRSSGPGQNRQERSTTVPASAPDQSEPRVPAEHPSQVPATHCRTPAASRRSRSGPMTARGTACEGCGLHRPAPQRPRARTRPPVARASTRTAAAPATAAPKPAPPRRTPPSWPAGAEHVTTPASLAMRSRSPRPCCVGGGASGRKGKGNWKMEAGPERRGGAWKGSVASEKLLKEPKN